MKKRVIFNFLSVPLGGLPGGSVVKSLPVNAGNAASILGWEDPLEKEMATRSSIAAWEIPWTEEPDCLQMILCFSNFPLKYSLWNEVRCK